ncbi:ArsR/SmtB family transcription factor [Evansella clarkii]|uniref:ArsR/SmtB family transcription factor n=1 Tax=Evansella clarkii TaxID=79879 RepID=UPI00099894A5|nr:helix-turn-helix transcriptional regulator [Evansella clarkii]
MQVISKFTPQMEFLVSLYVFSTKSLWKKVDLGTKWRNATAKSFDDEFLKSLQNEEILTTISCVHSAVLQGETGESIEDLLSWISETEDLPPSLPTINQLPAEPPVPIMETGPILEQWHRKYFSVLDPRIFQELNTQHLKTEEALSQLNEVEVIEKTTRGFYLENQPDEQKVFLLPQYHSRPVVLYSYGENQLFYQYAADGITGPGQSIPPESMRAQQALSDENRIKILKFLAEGQPETFKKIHEYSGLAKSTVHHHLISLRAAGLVRIHISPGRPESFSYREEGLTEMERKIKKYITS